MLSSMVRNRAFRESAIKESVIGSSLKAMGAQIISEIIWKVLLPESLPALVSGLTVTTISLSGLCCNGGCYWSAGGLGSLAYQDELPTWSKKYSYLSSGSDLYLSIIVFAIPMARGIQCAKNRWLDENGGNKMMKNVHYTIR